MNISLFIPSFLNSLKYRRDLKKAAKKLLMGNSREALTQQPGFEESEYLEPNMRDSVRKCVRIYDECRIIRYEGTDSVTIQCRQDQMNLDLARVLRSCYTLEELSDY